MLDQGWAWVVMVASYGCMLVNGVAYSLGVYVAELIIEHDLSRPSVALFGSLQIAANYMSGPMFYVSEMTSYRLVLFVSSLTAAVSTVASIFIKSMTALYITFGVIPGFCVGILALQSSIVMNRYFKKRSRFANCFSLAGCATGTLIFPPLFRAFIGTYGWRSSLFLVAGIYLQGCVFAACMRPVKQENTTESYDVDNNKQVVVIRNTIYRKPTFYLFMACLFLWSFSWPVVFVFAPTLFYESNMEGWQVDVLMSALGAANVVVRITFAFVLSVTKWDVLVVHIVAIVVLAVSLVLFVVKPHIALFTIACILFGLSYGCANCTQSLVSRHIGEVTHYNFVYSWSYVACILGTVFGPFLSGYIYDATLSHSAAFLSFAGVALLSAAVMTVAYFIDRRTAKHTTERQQREVEVFLRSEEMDTYS